MTGLPDFNYPAFRAAAADLRAQGFDVRSPTDNDDGSQGKPWAFYMRAALRMLVDCDEIALLPGWESSRGAVLERTVAEALGMPVRELPAPCPWCVEDAQRDERECTNCGDMVLILSSRDWCDGCEAEDV